MDDSLIVGGMTVSRSAALKHAKRYLTEGDGWAYPSYDGYDAEHAQGPLVDADQLAPLLLNVNRVSIRTFEALTRVRPQLQATLDQVAPDLDLARAGQEQLVLLGELFGVLDGDGIPGARGTVLSKMLHRKRPSFIPLYDRQVGSVYQDGASAPVPRVKDRGWQDFMPLYAEAIQKDLIQEMDFWLQISDLAPGPPITPLRALDIVAWWAGK